MGRGGGYSRELARYQRQHPQEVDPFAVVQRLQFSRLWGLTLTSYVSGAGSVTTHLVLLSALHQQVKQDMQGQNIPVCSLSQPHCRRRCIAAHTAKDYCSPHECLSFISSWRMDSPYCSWQALPFRGPFPNTSQQVMDKHKSR